MNKNLAFGLAILVTGILIGWFARGPGDGNTVKGEDSAKIRTPTDSENRTAPSPAPRPITKSERQGVARPAPVRGVEQHEREELDPMSAQMLEKQRKAQEQQLEDLAQKLGLSEGQKEQLAAVFEERLGALRELMVERNESEFGGDMEVFKEAGALVSGAGLRESLAEIVTPEQLDAYDEAKGRERDRKIESRAYQDLASVNTILELSEEQKDQVFEILREDAGAKIDAAEDVVAIMSLVSGGAGGGMINMNDPSMQDIFELSAELEQGEMEQSEILEELERRHELRVTQQVERLAPVLTENQVERYREHLAGSNTMLNMMKQQLHLIEEQP